MNNTVPQVKVGIMSEPVIEFSLHDDYLVGDKRVSGHQLAQAPLRCRGRG